MSEESPRAKLTNQDPEEQIAKSLREFAIVPSIHEKLAALAEILLRRPLSTKIG